MSRAVLLPTPGNNPFLVAAWLRNFDSWRRADDHLYVWVSWPQPREVIDVLFHQVAERGGSLYRQGEYAQRLEHGQALECLLHYATEEVTLLVEDDLYVRDPAALEAVTREVEDDRYDIVGAPRRNGSPELWSALEWNDTSALWPHLLIARTEKLKTVQEMWGSRTWRRGERIAGLLYRCSGTVYSDTAVAATLELRAGRAVHEIQTYNVEAAGDGQPWFHVGSLSTGPLMNFTHGQTPEEAAAGDQHSWAQRVAWWERVLRPGTLGLGDLHQTHTAALRRLCGVCGSDRVWGWQQRYDALVNWRETDE